MLESWLYSSIFLQISEYHVGWLAYRTVWTVTINFYSNLLVQVQQLHSHLLCQGAAWECWQRVKKCVQVLRKTWLELESSYQPRVLTLAFRDGKVVLVQLMLNYILDVQNLSSTLSMVKESKVCRSEAGELREQTKLPKSVSHGLFLMPEWHPMTDHCPKNIRLLIKDMFPEAYYVSIGWFIIFTNISVSRILGIQYVMLSSHQVDDDCYLFFFLLKSLLNLRNWDTRTALAFRNKMSTICNIHVASLMVLNMLDSVIPVGE